MLNVKVNEYVQLTDETTLQDYYNHYGKFVSDVPFKVIDIITIELELGISYQLIELEYYGEAIPAFSNIFIYTKTVDNETDIGIYTNYDMPEGNRRELIDCGEFWIFNKPENDEYEYNDLTFSDELIFDEGPAEFKFTKVLETCVGQDDDECLTLLTEYISYEDIGDPRVLIIERGGEDSDEGGLIQIFRGGLVNQEEVEVL